MRGTDSRGIGDAVLQSASKRGSARQVAGPSPFPTAHKPKIPASVLRPRPQPPSAPTRSDIVASLGEQIKALRLAANLSGGALALRSDISRSMLSRIERGLVSPSVETLDRIAHGLGQPLSRFFCDQPGRTDLSVVRAGHGIAVDRVGPVAGFDYELLGHGLSGNLFVEPYLVRVASDAPPYTSFQHPGIKFIYMLTGKVTYCYGPRKLQAIGAGDALMFDASALHGIDSVEEGPVSYLSVVFTLRS